MKFKKTILKNGLTIITVPMKENLSVTALVMVKTGSKYETKDINGISHFLEHMCFKGTVKRPKAIDISIELDSIGSQSNAFTAQEFTGYYAKSHPKHFSKILDVVSDVYLNSTFDQNEIEKERGVIVEELNMYEDIPQQLVAILFMETMYGDQPAGWNIGGSKEVVRKLNQKDFFEYRNKHYVAFATTVLISGNFDQEKAIKEIKKVFENIETSKKFPKPKVFEKQEKPNIKIKDKETDQTHLILGVRTFPAKSKKNYALEVLNAILGQGMSSRLFQKLREEMGVGYYVRSRIDEYTDHGFLAVFTGVDKDRVEEVVKAIIVEMNKLKTELVSEEEIKKAKEFLLGNMYLGLESSDAVAEYYAIQDAISDEMLTPSEYAKKIQKVTAKEIQKIAKEIFVDEKLNMAIVGNIKNKEDIEKAFHFSSSNEDK